jgi:hypothetical protein
LGAYSDEELKKFQESPMDEYGVNVLNIFYNRVDGLAFYLLEAPNRQATKNMEYIIGLLKGSLLLDYSIAYYEC